MSIDKSWVFSLFRTIVVLIATALQLVVLLINGVSNPIPYLISNLSIVCGYILDSCSFKQNFPTLKTWISISLVTQIIAVVLAISDAFFIGSIGNNMKLEGCANVFACVIIPIITLLALGVHSLLCIIITLKLSKDSKGFNVI